MNPQRWQQIKDVFEQALDHTSDQRVAFLKGACDGDSELHREVASLLAADAESSGAIDRPIFDLRPDSTPPTRVGSRIGPYELIEKIGQGGFGTVYLADRAGEFRHRVAVKLIQRGMSSPEAVRRFELERQILADLDHPNIARLFDGGTTEDGSPYLVMEWVEGERLDRYCDAEELSVEARLRQFLEICSAVQFAHHRLVVHRDLKPANVLVTADGVKLLDFGIAKLLGTADKPYGTLTVDGSSPMTYEYASPEQATGRAITTASDVYSLGVVLFELLTGHLPYRLDGCDTLERLRRICEQAPKKPSTAIRQTEQIATSQGASSATPESVSAARAATPAKLRRRLTGDLDSILLKALRKDPENRYSSVERLAEDIRRHLDGRPVLAREGRRLYQAGKFVKRNRWSLGGVTALATVIALGVGMRVQAAREIEQAQINESFAEERANVRLREATIRDEFLTNLFTPLDLDNNSSFTVSELLERGLNRARDNREGEPLAAQLSVLAQVYQNLQLANEARALLEEALHLLQETYTDDHDLIARTLNNLAAWHHRVGDHEKAKELYSQALEMKIRLGQNDKTFDTTMSNLASILTQQGDYEQAEKLYLKALTVRTETYGPKHYSVARTLRSLGILSYNRGEMAQAEPLLREALEIRHLTYGKEDVRVASAQSSLARILHHLGKPEEAKQLLAEVLSTRARLLGEEHLHVALTKKDLAAVHLSEGETEAAAKLLSQALAVLRESKSEGSWEIAEAESLWGSYLTAVGSFEEAESFLIDSYRTLIEARSSASIYTRDAYGRLTDHYAARGEPLPVWLRKTPQAQDTRK